MQHPEYQYLNLLQDILDNGDRRLDRTGVGTRAVFGRSMRFDLSAGFPLFTTKRVYWRTAFKEMLWMISGDDNIRALLEQNVHIWTDWPAKRYRETTGDNIADAEFEYRVLNDAAFARKWGSINRGYGYQWRHWPGRDGGEIDQLAKLVESIRNNPASRRHILEGWNVADVDGMALPPCHKTYQFLVSSDNKLSCVLSARSTDSVLGLPFNIINAALLTHMLAQQCDLMPHELIYNGSDVHVYSTHEAQVREQVSREPRAFPQLVIKRKPPTLFDYTIDDFDIEGYDPHPPIKAPVAV